MLVAVKRNGSVSAIVFVIVAERSVLTTSKVYVPKAVAKYVALVETSVPPNFHERE